MIYDLTLGYAFPPQIIDRRGEPADIRRRFAGGKLALYLR